MPDIAITASVMKNVSMTYLPGDIYQFENERRTKTASPSLGPSASQNRDEYSPKLLIREVIIAPLAYSHADQHGRKTG
jgi:hypothetical protein